MKNELEVEFQLAEMFGLGNRNERLRSLSVQKSTDAIDRFFERLELGDALGHGPDDSEKPVASRISSPDEPREVSDLRELVKAEKQRVPNMTARQMRSSMIHVLRKAADAMAAI